MGVHHPHPAQPLDLAQLDEQVRQVVTQAQVLAVVGGVFGHQGDLASAQLCERRGLFDQHLHGLAGQLASNLGDRAEGADVIAALAQAQVRGVRRGEQGSAQVCVPTFLAPTHQATVGQQVVRAGHGALVPQHGVDDGRHARVIREPQERVDLGDLFRQLLLVQLHQAAGDHHAPHVALLLHGDILKHRVDALFPSRVDEATGVDDDHVRIFGLGDQANASPVEVTHHDLAVHQVLGAAQGDQAHGAGRF